MNATGKTRTAGADGATETVGSGTPEWRGGDSAVAPVPLPPVNAAVAGGGSGLLHAAKLTVPQAAKALGIGETTMRAIVRNGDVPVVKMFGKVLLLERDLEAFLKANYGPLRKIEKKFRGKLAPLPQSVRESGMLKKAS